MKRFERVALWTGTVLAGIGAVCFAINAGSVLLNHPERTGELYGMGTAAAVCLFVFSYLRGAIRDRDERARLTLLTRAPTMPALNAASPEWSVAHDEVAAPVRLERDCPYCAERILVAARLCKHCHSDVSDR